MPGVSALIRQVRAGLRPLRPRPTGVPPRLPRLPGIRAVLFDVYGTLLISAAGDIHAGPAPDNLRADRTHLRRAGWQVGANHPLRPLHEEFSRVVRQEHARLWACGVVYPEVEVRDIWRHVLAGLKRRGEARGPLSRRALETLAVAHELHVNTAWHMPHAKATLARLHRQGLRLGIISNAQFYTPLVLEALFHAPLPALGFEPDLLGWSYKCREAKPSLRLFQKALAILRARHGIPPGAVAYVGNDLLNDLWPARQLGLRTVLFAGDRRSLRLRENDPRVRGLVPDAILTSLRQLPAVVGA